VGRELRPLVAALGEVRAPSESDLDFTDTERLRQAVRGFRPTLIVNAAAYTAVDRAESEPALAQAVNGTAPGVLAEEAAAIGAAIVHYSTDYVFDGSGSRPWTEDDAPRPLNAYGRSKLAGDRAVAASGAAFLILRTSWVYGRGGRNFVATMLRLGAGRAELSVVDDQVGAPTSAAVIASTTARLLGGVSGDPTGRVRERGGLYNLCCAGETSWFGFAREIFRLAATRGAALAVRELRPIATREFETAAVRPLNSRLDCGRLERTLGVSLPDWRDALRDFLAECYDPESGELL
jgi:dTDP-4-dehydrorhamnose reductase